MLVGDNCSPLSPSRPVYHLDLERMAKVVFAVKTPCLVILVGGIPRMYSGLESHHNCLSHLFLELEGRLMWPEGLS